MWGVFRRLPGAENTLREARFHLLSQGMALLPPLVKICENPTHSHDVEDVIRTTLGARTL